MIKKGQRVFVDFGTDSFVGVAFEDCEDWGAAPLQIRCDDDGSIYKLNTWFAHSVEVLQPTRKAND